MLRVGKPLTPWVLQSSLLALPSAVQSTCPIVTSALSGKMVKSIHYGKRSIFIPLYFSASFSQVGASRLQWPHLWIGVVKQYRLRLQNLTPLSINIVQCIHNDSHHGAKNLTKATPVLTSASKLSLSSLATGEAAAGSGTFPSWDAALPTIRIIDKCPC